MQKQLEVLHAIATWTKEGGDDIVTYGADPRHAETIVQDFGLQDATTLTTFIVKGEVADDSGKLEAGSTTARKSVVARANHLAADRPDIQFACKELGNPMAAPTQQDYEKFKRMGGYLLHKPRLVPRCHRPNSSMTLLSHTAANWAGDKTTRKSTSGGAIFIGVHWFKCWSETQAFISLSFSFELNAITLSNNFWSFVSGTAFFMNMSSNA